MLIRVLLLALILVRWGIGGLSLGIGIGIGIALVVVAILLAPKVDVLGVALGVFTDEKGNDLLDQTFDLSGLVVAFA